MQVLAEKLKELDQIFDQCMETGDFITAFKALLDTAKWIKETNQLSAYEKQILLSAIYEATKEFQETEKPKDPEAIELITEILKLSKL